MSTSVRLPQSQRTSHGNFGKVIREGRVGFARLSRDVCRLNEAHIYRYTQVVYARQQTL